MSMYPVLSRAVGASLLAALFLAAPARADDPQFPGATAPEPASQWGIGLGANVSAEQYRGAGSKTSPLPLIMYDSAHVRVFGNVLDLKLPPAAGVTFAVRVKYALGDGYDDNDSPYLRGMAERKGGLWLGGVATWKTAPVTLTAQWLKAAGNSRGQQFQLDAQHAFQLGRWQLVPHVDATWSDKQDVDYYYGVTNTEATPARPAYVGQASTDTTIGLRVNFAVRPHHILLLDVSDTHRGGGITDSPLVDKANVPSLKAGYLYQF